MKLYNSHGVWTTLGDLVKVEKEDRENDTFDKVDPTFLKKYKDSPAIWVTTNPYRALRYTIATPEGFMAPYEELQQKYLNVLDIVKEVSCSEAIMLMDTDDGDDGFVIVRLFQRKMNAARESFLKQLERENTDIDLESLSDQELKVLYVKSQKLRQGYCSYQVPKGVDFEEALKHGRLQFVSFRGTPGVRRLTFNEYLKLELFAESNNAVYPHFYKL